MKKKYFFAVIIVLLLAGAIVYQYTNKSNTYSGQKIAYATVTRGNISMSVTGSGNLSGDIRAITLKGNGVIKKVYYKVGDTVKKGDLLYELSDDNLNSQLEQAKFSLDLANQQLNQDTINYNNSISNLQIKSPSDGIVDSILVKEGQNVAVGTPIMSIANYSRVTVKVPFNGLQIKNIKVGQKADIFLYDSFTSVQGKVEYVSQQPVPNDTVQYYYVTVGLNNPGALSDGMKVQVSIYTDSGILKALEDGILNVKNLINVSAQTNGTIEKIYVLPSESVNKNQILVKLSSNNINDLQIQNDKLKVLQAQNNYNQILQQINDLKIYSPINGKILVQNINEGDILGNNISSLNTGMGSSSNIQSSSTQEFVPVLDITQISNYRNQPETCVISDSEKYLVDFLVDETDIMNVKKGQEVKLTTDNFPGRTFKGNVIQISQLPTIQNGVASYNVTIEVKPEDGLYLGMSMNISIIVSEKQNVLIVPIQAVYTNGNQKYVIIYSNNINAKNLNVKSDSEVFKNSIRIIQTGISNNNFVEVISGLKDGDKIIIPSVVEANNISSGNFGGMGGFRPSGNSSTRTFPTGGSYNGSRPNSGTTTGR